MLGPDEGRSTPGGAPHGGSEHQDVSVDTARPDDRHAEDAAESVADDGSFNGQPDPTAPPIPSAATLDGAQRTGTGDMDPDAFRRAAHVVADVMADYLAGVERFPVLPNVDPGELRGRFPTDPPDPPEPLESILDDYRRLVEPNVTHWQHPGFFAYFPSSGSAPGILGEMLMATLVGNAMLWRTSPIATELEHVTVDWLRAAFGLPEAFSGFYTDTASTSTLIALAAARQGARPQPDRAPRDVGGTPAGDAAAPGSGQATAGGDAPSPSHAEPGPWESAAVIDRDGDPSPAGAPGPTVPVEVTEATAGQDPDAGPADAPDAARDGLAGAPPLRIYASAEAHSSIDKAAMTLGIGRRGVRRISVDDSFAMDVSALEAAIAEDRAAGWVPCAIVSTIGTTGSTAVDPTAPIADVAEREGLWLHVDAAYAGPAALIPGMRALFEGWERADSVVVNPHKWLFTPLDCSLFLSRRLDVVRSAFSLVPEYLRTLGAEDVVHDVSEYTPQLGRRFRALKMWFLLRYFGLDGLRVRLEEHIELARRFRDWVAAEEEAELMAPVSFSTVCFRWRPTRYVGREHDPEVAAKLDGLNETLMARVNATGEAFISHTRLDGRFTLRLSIGNIRTGAVHVERAWQLIREIGRSLR